MIYLGKNITKSNTEQLQTINLKDIVQLCTSTELNDYVIKLRKVQNLDINAYQHIKKTLPYFIGATFKQNIRTSANFLKVNYLVIDIDHYGNNEKLENLKNKLSEDLRVKIAFISPGGTGLKLLFQLNKEITSLKEYSDFYQVFSRSLAKQYSLEKYIDFCTKDATRICFLSYDPNIYWNKHASEINTDFYIEHTLPFYNEVENDQNKDIVDNKKTTSNNNSKISNETYANILNTLNPKTPKPKKNYVVPKPLLKIKKQIPEAFLKHQFPTPEITEISYGLKVKITHNSNSVHINIYFGKKGFSVVKSTSSNQAEEFLKVAALIIENCIYNYEESNQNKQYSQQFNKLNKEEKESRIITFKPASGN